MMIPFLLFVLGVPLYSVCQLRLENGGALSFLSAYLHIFFLLNLFNLFDAVVLDLLILTFGKPKFAVLPGMALKSEFFVKLPTLRFQFCFSHLY